MDDYWFFFDGKIINYTFLYNILIVLTLPTDETKKKLSDTLLPKWPKVAVKKIIFSTRTALWTVKCDTVKLLGHGWLYVICKTSRTAEMVIESLYCIVCILCIHWSHWAFEYFPLKDDSARIRSKGLFFYCGCIFC